MFIIKWDRESNYEQKLKSVGPKLFLLKLLFDSTNDLFQPLWS